jgi:hypothetical protein
MPTEQQMTKFRELMTMLTAKTKEELKEMAFDPKCPPVVRDIIREHPALLGECFHELGPSEDHNAFVTATNAIIKAHGFSHTDEWEYELDQTTQRPVCLRIWLGKRGRTKKTLRMLTLTEEETTQIATLLA